MKIFSSPADRRRGVLAVIAVGLVFATLYFAVQRYASFITDAEALRVWLRQFGVLAPIVFILIQAVQVVVVPIPGQVIALTAGYLFGPLAGTVYSLTGVLIGSAVAFSLAKRYGRSFVEDVLHDDVIARFDDSVERVGVSGLFVLVIIPGLPDDAICFLSGLTTLSLSTFLVVISIGRLPAYAFTVYAGGQLASGRFLSAGILIAIIVVSSAVGYYKQEAIRDIVERVAARFPF